MTSFYETIIFVELSENQIPTDFDIISIRWNNRDKKMIFKVTQNDKLYYKKLMDIYKSFMNQHPLSKL